MKINGVNMPNFTHKEIPPEKAQYMDWLILRHIQTYRDILGCPFSVSLAQGALIRFSGRKTSEHHVIVNPVTGPPVKLSRAIDGFPECNIFEAWSVALSSMLFGGIGVYFDTLNNHGVPQPMLHLDLRSAPLIWYRNHGVYYYPHKDENFFKRLMDGFVKYK
jgi:hypothetical protein